MSLEPLFSANGTLRLEALTLEELDSVDRWFSNLETCRLAFGVQAPPDQLESLRSEYMAELKKDRSGVLAIKKVSSEQVQEVLCGFVRYKLFTRGRTRGARVGIVLGEPKLRKKGLGRAAFLTLLNYLFKERKVQLIELDTALFNEGAQACFASCGFSTQKQTKFITANGWAEERLVMQLTASQWGKVIKNF